MEKIAGIIRVLSKPEMKYLKNILLTFHGKGDNKLMELVELVEKKPEISQDEASLKLYGDPKSKAFLMTKSRLLERLMQVMQDGNRITNNPSVSNFERDYLHAYFLSGYSQCLMLHNRGAKEAAAYTLKDYLSHPQLSYFPSAKMMLHSLSQFVFHLSPEEYNALANLNQQCLAEIRLNDTAKIFLTECGKISAPFQSVENYERLSFMIQTLEAEFQSLITPYAKYCYLTIQSRFCEFFGRPDEYKKTVEQLVLLFEEHPILSSTNRRSILIVKLAFIKQQENQIDAAIALFEEALILAENYKKNFQAVLQMLMGVCIHGKQWDKAKEVYQMYHKNLSNIESKQKFEYFYSCIYYVENNPKKFLQALSTFDFLWDQKDAYNGPLRIAEILALIDTQKQDIAIAKIEALRKHQQKHLATKREITIYKILNKLMLRSFSFQDVAYFEELLKSLEETPFLFDSLECIQFEYWMRAHLQGIKYKEIIDKINAQMP